MTAIRLPSLTNLDVEQFPLRPTLRRLRTAGANILAQKRAVTGRPRASRRWDQTTNYLTALRALGILTREGLSPIGAELANASADEFNSQLAQHVMTRTSLGIVVRVLQYVAPHYAGDALIRETMRTLEVAFNVQVPARKQLFNYIFRFLRSIGLTNADNIPNRGFISAALGFAPDPYLDTLATISREEALVLQELIVLADEGPVRAERLKARLRERYDEVLEVGVGGQGLGRRLASRGLVRISGGAGRGNRGTHLSLRSSVVKNFLASPLARAYLVRANFEAGGLLANLRELIGCPLSTLIRRMQRNPDNGRALELVAAKIALKLGCSDITIRSRLTLPNVVAEGEKDVLATIPRPLPYRLLIQCKAHRTAVGTADLYREIAVALLSTQVRTILFFSTHGYRGSTKLMQRACLRAFPYLTVVLFDGQDLATIGRGVQDAAQLVGSRLRQVAQEQRIVEEVLSPRQIRLVRKVLGDVGIPAGRIRQIVDALWQPDWGAPSTLAAKMLG
jgi:hypothetical protein